MSSLKEIPSRVWAFVLKHSNVVVTVLVCLCFFFFYKVSNDTKRYEELHNLQMENVMIVNDIRQSMDMLGEQSRHIDAMEEALEMRTDQLNEAVSFINLLIKKLQSLGEWPLKGESLPRPGSPTKSEA